MDLFGVVGRPILHSRSPELHNAAFSALGMDACYVRIAARHAAQALQTARSLGARGLNATAPFKGAVAELAGQRSEVVSALGAANTLLRYDDDWHAHNTDVAGVLDALARHDVRLGGARAVVLGAGGAALAAASALHRAGAEVTVSSRKPSRARAVAHVVGCASSSLHEAALIAREAEVIVSAVSTDERVLDPDCLRPGTVILDARYQSETALVRDARERACVIVDGREWLLHQAAEAFRLFTGVEAPLPAMEEALGREPPRRGALISLVGFMGTGKTTVARLLGQRLNLPVADTDSLVEQRSGVSVARWLEQHGEPALRDRELEVVEAIPDAPCVLSCGGGLVTHSRSTESLRRKSRLVVWLWASPAACLARISDHAGRPLLGPRPETSAPRLLRQRMGLYARACDVVVDTEGRSAVDVVDTITELMGERT